MFLFWEIEPNKFFRNIRGMKKNNNCMSGLKKVPHTSLFETSYELHLILPVKTQIQLQIFGVLKRYIYKQCYFVTIPFADMLIDFSFLLPLDFQYKWVSSR